jgi:hypothetical protein
MKEEPARPEQVMAGLFKGLAKHEQMTLMARLEHGGSDLYRAWAASERNVKAREALIAAANCEDENAQLLRLMTTPKKQCEKCDKPLAPDAPAYACAFQCTFCPECEAGYQHVCPNLRRGAIPSAVHLTMRNSRIAENGIKLREDAEGITCRTN